MSWGKFIATAELFGAYYQSYSVVLLVTSIFSNIANLFYVLTMRRLLYSHTPCS